MMTRKEWERFLSNDVVVYPYIIFIHLLHDGVFSRGGSSASIWLEVEGTMGAETEEQGKRDDEIERPRARPITESQFLSWKNQKDAAASARKAEASRKRAEDIAAGIVQMNGRELFQHEPWVFDNSLY